MSRLEKLRERIKGIPSDFTWKELRSLLVGLGYEEIQGSGSRVKFRHPQTKNKILLHKPHGSDPVGQCTVKDVVEHLEDLGLL